MGWWDEGIMGGDTPLDFQSCFEDRFGSQDPDFNKWRIEDGEEAVTYVIPEPSDVVALVHETTAEWGDGEIFRQVAGWLTMERGAPMSDDLRTMVLQGIDSEINGGAETWGDPEVRIARLREFREKVVQYPEAGGTTDLPGSPGLLDKLAEHLNR